MYTVYYNVGGTIYRGRSLTRAVAAAASEWGAEPYVHSRRGKRPVALDQDGRPRLGSFGESIDALLDRLWEETEGLGV